jgi:hypothetical protein
MTERKHSHYYRRCPYHHIDVYRVLELFEVTDPALQHIVKKALCAGKRGAKDFRKDLEEIVDTGNRRIEMLDEDARVSDREAIMPLKRDSQGRMSVDGWIPNDGKGFLPDAEQIVDIKYRDESTNTSGIRAWRLDWSHDGSSTDIIAYRLHK